MIIFRFVMSLVTVTVYTLMVQHFNGHMAALGAASVIEEGIRPYDGHRFVNDGRDGEHHVIYGGVEYKMHTVHQKEITITRV